MRALVTGATGFVGSHLARALIEAGHEVAVLRRPASKVEALAGLAVEHVLGDLAADEESIDQAVGESRADTVFHVAGAYSVWDAIHPELYRTNVLGTRAIVRACVRRGLRLVKTGSCVPFCGTRAPRVCDEEGAGPGDLGPWSSFHVVSMALAEREVLAGAARGTFAVQVHPGLVLGEGDVHYHAAWIFAAALRGGLLGRISWPGGVNLCDIRDVVRAHLLALERGRSGESYLVGGENRTHAEILAAAEEVARGAGAVRRRLAVGRLPMLALGLAGEVAGRWRGDDRRNRIALNARGAELSSLYWWFTSAKAERDLGFRAGPVRPAMERAWAWLRERFERGRANRE